MCYFAIITPVMMPRGDPGETNRPCLGAGCHTNQPKLSLSATFFIYEVSREVIVKFRQNPIL
jgi:hypothetical protein